MTEYTRSEIKARARRWNAGERARLWWNGFPQVPRYMSDWIVTVERCTRNTPYSIPLYRVLTHDGEHRTVRADQLIEVEG